LGLAGRDACAYVDGVSGLDPIIIGEILASAGCALLLVNTAQGDAPDPWAARRRRMMQEQFTRPDRRITNSQVLAALSAIPRHEFVPEEQRPFAYEDRALPIGCGQTISQPYIVGLMSELLAPRPTDRVLEIGTGSGYQTAILSALVGEVFTVEIVPALATRAALALKNRGCTNVHLRQGDGYQGWPEAAPFDAIIVTCAPEAVPPPLVEQLKADGRMIIPIGPLEDQRLVLLHKQDRRLETITVLPVRFVPMTGEAERGQSRS